MPDPRFKKSEDYEIQEINAILGYDALGVGQNVHRLRKQISPFFDSLDTLEKLAKGSR